jgi:hypothetical protein
MPKMPKRLAGPLLVTNAVTTRYTVPASTQTIIRHIHVENNTASPVTFTMSIGADAAGTRIYDAFPMVANQVLDVFCYYILTAAEIVQTNASVTNVLALTMDGDEYTAG